MPSLVVVEVVDDVEAVDDVAVVDDVAPVCAEALEFDEAVPASDARERGAVIVEWDVSGGALSRVRGDASGSLLHVLGGSL